MYYALRTISYFLTWGTFYGLLLGLWATTVMFPGLGTMMGVVWGPGVGAACGLICGILVAFIQAITFHEQTDLVQYQNRLSRVIGLLTAVAAPVLVFATSEGTLWTHYTNWRPDAAEFFIPSLLSAAFWGGLSAAYVTRSDPLWLADLKRSQAHKQVWPALKTPFRSAWNITRDTLVTALAAYIPARWLARVRLHETETTHALTRRWQLPSMLLSLLREMFHWPFAFVAAFLGIAFVLFDLSANSLFPNPNLNLIRTFLLAIPASAGISLMLAIGNSALMTFVRELFFGDDTSVSPLYARRLMTGVSIALTVSLVIYYLVSFSGSDLWPALLPWPFFVGWASWQAQPRFDLLSEKAKRKEKNAPEKAKNALSLDEDTTEDDVYNAVDEAALKTTQILLE